MKVFKLLWPFFKPTRGKAGVFLVISTINFLLDPSVLETSPIASILVLPGLLIVFLVTDSDPTFKQHYGQGWVLMEDYASGKFFHFILLNPILARLYFTTCNFPFLYLLSCTIIFLVAKLKKSNRK